MKIKLYKKIQGIMSFKKRTRSTEKINNKHKYFIVQV